MMEVELSRNHSIESIRLEQGKEEQKIIIEYEDGKDVCRNSSRGKVGTEIEKEKLKLSTGLSEARTRYD